MTRSRVEERRRERQTEQAPRRATAAAASTTRPRRPQRVVATRRSRGRPIKIVFGLVSAMVLGMTGYGWATFQSLQQGLTTTDVVGFSAPDGSTDVLLVGIDSRTDAQGNPLPAEVLAQLRAGDNEGELTDTMILVRIPNDGQRAVAISLPRDLYVEMPDGYGDHKLNSAFGRAKRTEEARLIEEGAAPETVRTESLAAGRRLLLDTVEDLTGVEVDNYAEINLLGFSLLTDAVGGVDVCLNNAVQDDFSGANFPAGLQRISGPDALSFVRQRHGLPRSDLDRVVRQQVFLAGLASQVLSAGTLANPGRINELIGATQQSLVLDDNFDVLDFADRMSGLAAGNVEFVTIPITGEDTTESDGDVLVADPDEVQEFAASVIGGGPGGASTDPNAPAPVVVDVLNASGISGLASEVADALTDAGFDEGQVGNADPRTATVVRFAPGGQADGDAVAAALGGGVIVEQDANLVPGTVQVYLGEDYSGPGTQGFAGEPLLRLDGLSRLDGRRSVPEPLRAQAPPPGSPVVAGTVPCVD